MRNQSLNTRKAHVHQENLFKPLQTSSSLFNPLQSSSNLFKPLQTTTSNNLSATCLLCHCTYKKNMPRIARHLHRIDSSQFRREEASDSDDESDESSVGTIDAAAAVSSNALRCEVTSSTRMKNKKHMHFTIRHNPILLSGAGNSSERVTYGTAY
jgi:hypothetical protein